MVWKSVDGQLLEEARVARSLTPDARLRALFSMVQTVRRMLLDTGAWERKLRLYSQEEEAGRRRTREWIRRSGG